MVRFIGEDEYYPYWTKGKGRWVIQRTFTTLTKWELLQSVDIFGKPTIADEGVVWVPPRGGLNGIKSAFAGSAESWRALYELQYIPFICSAQYDKCTWNGLQGRVWLDGSSPRPMFWRVRCPKCGNIALPDVSGFDSEIIFNRWISLDKPVLDNPAAAKTIKSVKRISDIPKWIDDFRPTSMELAYVGQQMWPSLAHFLQDAKKP